ncbi:GNAT family N-acetyltransferase [Nocardioides sp. C4-1]|uniref:GNAT family N-acetyltransferase n=1 Tax=Nocardioides sp. C4-1 TaxID=3151851 RepID=UPI00326491B7
MIREAGPDDADALARLEEENLGVDAWSSTLVAAGVSGEVPTVTWFVAEPDDAAGGPAGYAVVSLAGEVAELQRIAVTPARRRTGLARALVDVVVAAARAGGAERVLLEVREHNEAALALYAERGFVEIARRRRYYRDGETAVVMSLGLT